MSEQSPRSLSQRVRALMSGQMTTHAASAGGLLQRFDALDEQLAALAQRPAPDLGELQTLLAGVEKQLARNGREQLKANALVEAQQEQTREALALLQSASARQDDALAAFQEELPAREAAARLELVRRTLPAIDGLDEALRAGAALLDQPAAARAPTLFERMRAVAPAPTSTDMQLREGLRAWLHGLTFVRQRLLDLLAAEDVRPIAALGAPFDPNLHIALQVIPSTNDALPGTVAAELRRGYSVGTRVLRHAEVAVAQIERYEASAEQLFDNEREA